MPYRALVGSSRVRSYQPSARNTPGYVPSARLPQRLADETDSFGFENERDTQRPRAFGGSSGSGPNRWPASISLWKKLKREAWKSWNGKLMR